MAYTDGYEGGYSGFLFLPNVAITIEAGFGSDPFDTVITWTELTDRVGWPGGMTWSYGRATNQSQPQAGSGFITFDNSDRALDPTNTASPYWPNVKPMVPIRCRVVHNDVTRDVFYAHAEAWPPEWEGEAGWVTVPLVDGMKLLSMARTSAAFPEQLSGARINALLDAAGWPSARRKIDTGRSVIQAYQASQRIVLNALKDTADTESGVFYIDPAGNAKFLDRDTLFLENTPLATFNETTLPYETITPSYDESDIWNDVAFTRLGGSVQRATDTASQEAFGWRELPVADLPFASDNDALDAANWTLARFKDPELRVNRLTLEGDLFFGEGTDPDILEQILARVVGDLITAEGQPAGGGTPLTVDAFVDHVTHRIESNTWRTTWRLSPHFEFLPWLLGVAGRSELGVTTFLGY